MVSVVGVGSGEADQGAVGKMYSVSGNAPKEFSTYTFPCFGSTFISRFDCALAVSSSIGPGAHAPVVWSMDSYAAYTAPPAIIVR